MLRHISKKVIPKHHFTCPKTFNRQINNIWKKRWIPIAHSCELPENTWINRKINNYDMLISRDKKNNLNAVANVCSHWGAQLKSDESGVLGNGFMCPNHYWKFSPNGEKINVPKECEHANNLRKYKINEVGGLVFASIEGNNEEFDNFKQDVELYLNQQNLENAKIAHTMECQVNASSLLVWMNNRECWHCRGNHPEYIKTNYDLFYDYNDEGNRTISKKTSRRLRKKIDSSINIQQNKWEIMGLKPLPSTETVWKDWYKMSRVPLKKEWYTESLDGYATCTKPLMCEGFPYSTGSFRMHFLPGGWIHSMRDYTATAFLYPIDATTTNIRINWLVHKDAKEEEDYHMERLVRVWRETATQDNELCERIQKGITHPDYEEGPLYMRMEYGVGDFLGWYLKQMETETT
jgi:Rieske 2Fe-2S family protein